MADNTFVGFSDEGADEYNQFKGDYSRRRPFHLGGPGSVGLPPTSDDPRADDEPWMYIVLTPVGGIPAMCEETITGGGTGSGTQWDMFCGTGVGTGTGIGDQGDRPGFASCAVYYLTYSTFKGRALTRPRLEPLGFSINVYNPRFTAINGSQFVTAIRDAFGFYWVPTNGDLFTTC